MPLGPDRVHVLARLQLPSRYESLAAVVGDEVARVLVEPAIEIRRKFEDAAAGVRAQGRGVFAPLTARSGTGKSTLAANLNHWFSASFTPTAVVRGDIDSAALTSAAEEVLRDLPASEARLVPIAIEDREFAAPTDLELAQIKSFLRTQTGARSLVLWLETDDARAEAISSRFVAAAGLSPIELPLYAQGPPQQTWPDVASNTLRLVNGLDSLEHLGIDPADFDPAHARTLGDYSTASRTTSLLKPRHCFVLLRDPFV